MKKVAKTLNADIKYKPSHKPGHPYTPTHIHTHTYTHSHTHTQGLFKMQIYIMEQKCQQLMIMHKRKIETLL